MGHREAHRRSPPSGIPARYSSGRFMGLGWGCHVHMPAIPCSKLCFWIQGAQSFGPGGLEKLPVGGDKQDRLFKG